MRDLFQNFDTCLPVSLKSHINTTGGLGSSLWKIIKKLNTKQLYKSHIRFGSRYGK